MSSRWDVGGPRDFWGCLLSLTLDAVLKTPPLDLRRERCCHRVLAGRINNQRINNYTRSFRKNLNTSIHSDDNSLNTAWFFFESGNLVDMFFQTADVFPWKLIFWPGDTMEKLFFFFKLLSHYRAVSPLFSAQWLEGNVGFPVMLCVSFFAAVSDGWRIPPFFLPSFLPQVRFLHG